MPTTEPTDFLVVYAHSDEFAPEFTQPFGPLRPRPHGEVFGKVFFKRRKAGPREYGANIRLEICMECYRVVPHINFVDEDGDNWYPAIGHNCHLGKNPDDDLI